MKIQHKTEHSSKKSEIVTTDKTSRLKSLFFIFIIASIPVITPLITEPVPYVVTAFETPLEQNYQDYGIHKVQLTPGKAQFSLAGTGTETGTGSPQNAQGAPPNNLANPGTITGTTTPNSPPPSSSSSSPSTTANNTFNLKSGNQVIPISYTIDGGQLKNLTVLPSNSTLLVDLDTTETSFGGKLTINLPRSVIDSLNPANSGDVPFLVFDDGRPITQSVLEQGQNQQTRPLTLMFDGGPSKIQIKGTKTVALLPSSSTTSLGTTPGPAGTSTPPPPPPSSSSSSSSPSSSVTINSPNNSPSSPNNPPTQNPGGYPHDFTEPLYNKGLNPTESDTHISNHISRMSKLILI